MFNTTIKKSFRKALLQLSEENNLNKNDLLKVYLNETSTNMNLTKYQHQNSTLLKDCFNNLYVINDNKLELMGYINDDNELVFDELIKQKLAVPDEEEKKEEIIEPEKS